MKRVHSVLTLHNLPFMGGDGTDVLAAYGLVPPTDEALPGWARTQPLPLGLWSADAVVAVSPTYAHEILTPDFGCGLDGFLGSRSASITGILNGLDLAAWDPETDKCLSRKFLCRESVRPGSQQGGPAKPVGPAGRSAYSHPGHDRTDRPAEGCGYHPRCACAR